MNPEELPPQALGQAIAWAASHGGTDGLVHHSDHGVQCISTVYATRVMEYGMLPSTGTVGDCFASMFVRQVRQCFSVVWADGFPRCRHRFPVM